MDSWTSAKLPVTMTSISNLLLGEALWVCNCGTHSKCCSTHALEMCCSRLAQRFTWPTALPQVVARREGLPGGQQVAACKHALLPPGVCNFQTSWTKNGAPSANTFSHESFFHFSNLSDCFMTVCKCLGIQLWALCENSLVCKRQA